MGSIGVFDSGIGGFSILKDLVKVFKGEDIYYVADQKNVPYSTKSEEFIVDRSIEITKFLSSLGCTTIVVACNTATVFSIEKLRSKFKKLKFVGVEPAIKPASKSGKGDVLVLATANTIKSKRLHSLVSKYAKNKKVHYQDMYNWVIWAEKGMMDSPAVEKYSRQILSGYKNNNISSVVLACTHYPLYNSLVKKIFKKATIIDPSKAVAAQAKKIHVSNKKGKSKVTLFSSKSKSSLQSVINLLPFQVEIESTSI